MHKQAKGSILLLLCAMIWGAAFVAQSESMQYIGPFTMGAARFFLAGLVLLPVIAVLDRKGWSQNRPVTGAEKKKQLAPLRAELEELRTENEALRQALAEIKPRQPEAAAEAQPQAPGSDA